MVLPLLLFTPTSSSSSVSPLFSHIHHVSPSHVEPFVSSHVLRLNTFLISYLVPLLTCIIFHSFILSSLLFFPLTLQFSVSFSFLFFFCPFIYFSSVTSFSHLICFACLQSPARIHFFKPAPADTRKAPYQN